MTLLNIQKGLSLRINGQRVWVLGAGKFGCRAAEKLGQNDPSLTLRVIDDDLNRLQQMAGYSVEKIAMDGIDLLSIIDQADYSSDWIIPAIPHHVAFEWIYRKLLQSKLEIDIIIPSVDLMERFPNPIRTLTGAIYTSHADFICPENCPEPAKICLHTGKQRPVALWRYLGRASFTDYKSIVIQSHQLMAGVGGYPFGALRKAFKILLKYRGKVLLATACKCHGVVHAFKIQ